MQDFYRVIADQGRRPNILSQIETGNEYFSYFIINLLVVQNVITGQVRVFILICWQLHTVRGLSPLTFHHRIDTE